MNNWTHNGELYRPRLSFPQSAGPGPLSPSTPPGPAAPSLEAAPASGGLGAAGAASSEGGKVSGRDNPQPDRASSVHAPPSLSDPKPPRRINNPLVFERFHQRAPDCISCGSRHVQAHHLISRARGGDDVMANLLPLCAGCHGALHGSPFSSYGHRITSDTVHYKIGRFLVSEAGTDHVVYVLKKLGVEAGIAFLERFGSYE